MSKSNAVNKFLEDKLVHEVENLSLFDVRHKFHYPTDNEDEKQVTIFCDSVENFNSSEMTVILTVNGQKLGARKIFKPREVKILTKESERGKLTEICFRVLMLTIAEVIRKFHYEKITGSGEEKKEEVFDKKIIKASGKVIKEDKVLKFLMESLKEYIVGERIPKLVSILAILSSLQAIQNLHIMMVGSSQKGKSAVQEMCLLLYNNSEVVNSLSELSLYYEAAQDSQRFSGKVMLLDEFLDKTNVYDFIKSITTQGRKDVTHKTVIDFQFKEFKMEGLPVVFVNSIKPPQDKQITNRFVVVNVDESMKQDSDIAEFQKRLYGFGIENIYKDVLNEDIRTARCIIKELGKQSFNVLVPFAHLIKPKVIEKRNELPKFFSVLKAVAIAHQNKRIVIDAGDEFNKSIIATRTDFEIANELFSHLQFYQYGYTDVDLSIRNFLFDIAKSEHVDDDTDIFDICDALKFEKKVVKESLLKLSNKGIVRKAKKSGVVKYRYHEKRESFDRNYAGMDWSKYTIKLLKKYIAELKIVLSSLTKGKHKVKIAIKTYSGSVAKIRDILEGSTKNKKRFSIVHENYVKGKKSREIKVKDVFSSVFDDEEFLTYELDKALDF